jgi:hypothetical protein
MKISLRYLIPILGLAVVLPALRADDQSAPTAPQEDRKGLRVITGPDHHAIIKRIGAGEMEPGTFLGVETGPVSATLTAQLGLQDGAGLVVNHVVPDSPAAAALKQHDILLKLDDQLLIEQRQLQVLVRGHKDGDEVTLTFLRGGKPSTAKVKLAKHDVQKLGLEMTPALPGLGGNANAFGFATAPGNLDALAALPGQIANQDDVNRLLSLIEGGLQPGLQRMNIVRSAGGPGDRTINVTVNTGDSHIALSDDKGSLDLTLKDGRKALVAKNARGEQVFAGPIDTPEQRKSLPEDVRSRLEKLEDSTQFSFKTDGDFKGTETKIVPPRGQGVSASAVPAASTSVTLFF